MMRGMNLWLTSAISIVLLSVCMLLVYDYTTTRRFDLFRGDYVDIEAVFTKDMISAREQFDPLVDSRKTYSGIIEHCVRWTEGGGGFVFRVPLEFIEGIVENFNENTVLFNVIDYDTSWLVKGGMLSRGHFQGQWIRKNKIPRCDRDRVLPCR